jgi:hypothetical protein
MATKKGIAITAIILVAIATASFSVWIIPQNNQISFVVTDFAAHLDGVKNIHKIIIEDLELEFNGLLDGNTSPTEYIQIAEVSSTQINSQIIQIVESKASEEWQNSYLKYLESLRKSNSYVRETIVYANMLNENKSSEELEKTLENINSIKSEFELLIKASDNARP